MTSLNHDDSIEIISIQADSTLPETGFLDLTTITPTSAEDRFRVLPPHHADPNSIKKQKRIKGAVMVVASLLIIMSVVLVGVTLSLSDHIDEMVRRVNTMSTTPKPVVLPPKTNTTIPYG